MAARAGNIHNDALDHLKANFDIDGYTHNDAGDIVTDMFSSLGSYFQSTEGWSSSSLNTSNLRGVAVDMLEDDWMADQAGIWGAWRNHSVMSNLSSAELTFVDQIRGVLFQDFDGLSRVQICDLVIDEADDLIDDFNNTSWPEGEGTLACGLLHVMRSSAEYWKDNNPTTFWTGTTGTGGGVPPAFRADCIGYLTGWASALWDDMNSPGGVTSQGQWRRIGQGLIWGSSASALATF